MRIVFKGIKRETGLTSSLCVLSVIGAFKSTNKTIVIQHKASGSDLRNMFTTATDIRRVNEASSYYVLEGMDYLLWNYENGSLNKGVIDEVLVPVVDKKLYYLPSGERLTPDLYPEKTAESEMAILKELDKMADDVMIDCGTLDDEFTKAVIKTADLVVNVLPQDETVLNNFFNGEKKSDKNIYLFSNYDSKSVLNLKNIARIYRLSNHRICSISENPAFSIALAKGTVKGFVEKNYRMSLSIRNEVFMSDVKNTYDVINEAVGKDADFRETYIGDGNLGLCGTYKRPYKRDFKRKFV